MTQSDFKTKLKDYLLNAQKDGQYVISSETILEMAKEELIKRGELADTQTIKKEQNPELVQHPPITYMYPSDASRDEQLKRAIIALLNSDLIKVAGNKFTKQDLIDWVEKQKPAEWSEEDEEMLEYVIGDVNDAKQLFATKEAIDLCDKEIAWLKSIRPQKKED